jgi:hypothetical protein
MQPDNHLIVMWGSKGGAGTTVTAAATALHETEHVLLVDLAGDTAAVLGVREQEFGTRAWLASDAEPDRLIEFTDRIDDTTSLIQAGRSDPDHGRHRPHRIAELADWLGRQPGIVVVDAGTGSPPPELYFAAHRNLLVTRPDYLALTAATRTALRPDEIFLVNEPGRSLTERDVASAIGAPVTGQVDLDPAIARAVDSGLFIGRSSLKRATRHLTDRHLTIGPPGPEVDYGMQWTNKLNDHTFRLSYDPSTKQLAFVDNETNARHAVATFATSADVDEALAGWATHHQDTATGLDWVHGQLVGHPTNIADESMNPPTGDSTAFRKYRSENFDELERTGSVNSVDAWIEQLESGTPDVGPTDVGELMDPPTIDTDMPTMSIDLPGP